MPGPRERSNFLFENRNAPDRVFKTKLAKGGREIATAVLFSNASDQLIETQTIGAGEIVESSPRKIVQLQRVTPTDVLDYPVPHFRRSRGR